MNRSRLTFARPAHEANRRLSPRTQFDSSCWDTFTPNATDLSLQRRASACGDVPVRRILLERKGPDSLVQHDIRPDPTPRHRQRVQQVPEPVFLPEHDPPRVVYAQAVREAEVFGVAWFGEGREGWRGRRGVVRRWGGGGSEVLRGAKVRDDFARERVECKDALRSRQRASVSQTQARRGDQTHREWRVVVPRRMMQCSPQYGRPFPRLALFTPEHVCRVLDRQPRFPLPRLLACRREVRVGDGRVFRIRAGGEAGGDKVLCKRASEISRRVYHRLCR